MESVRFQKVLKDNRHPKCPWVFFGEMARIMDFRSLTSSLATLHALLSRVRGVEFCSWGPSGASKTKGLAEANPFVLF